MCIVFVCVSVFREFSEVKEFKEVRDSQKQILGVIAKLTNFSKFTSLNYFLLFSSISPNSPMLATVRWGCFAAAAATSSVVSPESTNTPKAPAL